MPHLQRDTGNDDPERLSDAFRLTKQKDHNTVTAVCEVWSHAFGWELRLMVNDSGLQMSSVVRSAGEMTTISEQWKAAMIKKGWG
jgi:hypothetical protein